MTPIQIEPDRTQECPECRGRGYHLIPCGCCRGNLDGYAEERCLECQGRGRVQREDED